MNPAVVESVESLRFGGWYHSFRDIYTVTPAEAWLALVKERIK